MVKAGASRFYSSGGQGARAVTVVQLSASRSASHIHDPVQCGMPVCSVENGGAGAAHFGVAVDGSGCARPLGDGAGRRLQARGVPDRPSRCFTQGRSTVPHQLRSARTAAAKQLRTSHRGATALLSAAAARGQPGQRRAPRPVSPRTATLMADARCARRSADALNELRPLRQRVSRAAGICLPAAAGCQRSLARRCRQSAA